MSSRIQSWLLCSTWMKSDPTPGSRTTSIHPTQNSERQLKSRSRSRSQEESNVSTPLPPLFQKSQLRIFCFPTLFLCQASSFNLLANLEKKRNYTILPYPTKLREVWQRTEASHHFWEMGDGRWEMGDEGGGS